jgi:hypothetical protein
MIDTLEFNQTPLAFELCVQLSESGFPQDKALLSWYRDKMIPGMLEYRTILSFTNLMSSELKEGKIVVVAACPNGEELLAWIHTLVKCHRWLVVRDSRVNCHDGKIDSVTTVNCYLPFAAYRLFRSQKLTDNLDLVETAIWLSNRQKARNPLVIKR